MAKIIKGENSVVGKAPASQGASEGSRIVRLDSIPPRPSSGREGSKIIRRDSLPPEPTSSREGSKIIRRDSLPPEPTRAGRSQIVRSEDIVAEESKSKIIRRQSLAPERSQVVQSEDIVAEESRSKIIRRQSLGVEATLIGADGTPRASSTPSASASSLGGSKVVGSSSTKTKRPGSPSEAIAAKVKAMALAKKASQQRARGTADAIVARAESEAQELYEQVEAEVQVGIEAAHKRGHAKGLSELAELRGKLEKLGHNLQADSEAQALQAAVRISRILLDTEFERHPESIIAVVRKAVMSTRQQREIFVRVHPSQVEILRANKRTIIDVLGRAKDIDIREDEDLAPGGCFIETEIGTVDARLETQFDALMRHMQGG